MDYTGRRELFVLTLTVNYYLLRAGEHGQDKLDTVKRRIVKARQLNPKPLFADLGRLLRRRSALLVVRQKDAHTLDGELRLLLVTKREPARYDERRILGDKLAEAVQRTGKRHQLHVAAVVLQPYRTHNGAVFVARFLTVRTMPATVTS